VSSYVQDACASEGAQLRAFQSFLLHTGIAASLQVHDWISVARKYNGSGQVAVYASRLQSNYNQLLDPARLPDLNVRAAQLYLTYLAQSEANPAFDPGGIDGIAGTPGKSHTLAALSAFQTTQGLPGNTTIDEETVAMLAAALPVAASLTLA